MAKANSLEDLIKQYMSNNPTYGSPDSYDVYKHKNGLDTAKSYQDAVGALYASYKKDLSSYGANSREISNKGLQKSGYSAYVDALADNSFKYGSKALSDAYKQAEEKNRLSYASYLDSFSNKQQSVKKSVMSHLIDNDIVDQNTAIAYGMNAGLSYDDAVAAGQSAYEVTRQKVLNEILKQTVSLGLDQRGAKMLAVKMGVTESDADAISKEVSELLEYYRNISADYLEFLEQRSY